MDKKQLKKILAGLSIAGLLAGAGLTINGCAKTSCSGGTVEQGSQTSCSGSKTSCGGSKTKTSCN